MNCIGRKLNVFIILIIASFFFSERVFSQYDDQQIQFVISKLKEKNLLSNLIDLTRADSRQSATRADVLVACYLVVRYLDDNSDIAGLNRKLTGLQSSVQALEKQGGRSPSEEMLVQRVLERVEKSLPQSQAPLPGEMNQQIDELRTTVDSIKNALRKTQPRKIEQLEKRVHNNTIIASAAVVLSLVITIFAAR